MWQEEFDVFLATRKDLVVNDLLKKQGIKDIIGDRKLEEYGKYECDQFDKNYTSKSSLLSSQAEQILNGLQTSLI